MANFIHACNAFHDAYEVVHHFKLPAVAVQHFKPTCRHFIKKDGSCEPSFFIRYVKREYGGAFQAIKYAERKGKRIINIAERK